MSRKSRFPSFQETLGTYQTVTDGFSGTFAATSLRAPPCSGVASQPASTAGAVPTSSTVSYVAERVEEDRVPRISAPFDFNSAKERGSIVMTNYLRSRKQTSITPVSRPRRFRVWRRNWAVCGSLCGEKLDQGFRDRHWTETSHLYSELPFFTLDWTPTLNAEIADLISSTQTDAWNQAMSQYDLLTEIGELKETTSLLTAFTKDGMRKLFSVYDQTDRATWRAAKRLNARQMAKSAIPPIRKFASIWLAAQFAIKPVISSIEDVAKVLKQRGEVYRTSRKWKGLSLQLSSPLPTPAPLAYRYVKTSADVRVTSTVKLGFDKGALQRLASQVRFNPLVTAWELIPMSFVVDWFVNVGDTLSAIATPDFSSRRNACTSVRRKVETVYALRDTSSDVSTQLMPGSVCYPAVTNTYTFSRDVDSPLQTVVLDQYERFRWLSPEPKLHLQFPGDWKQHVSGLALTIQPLSKRLKGL